MNTKQSQNSGIQLVSVPILHKILSGHRSSCQAQNSPSSSASTKVSTNPTPPRSTVLPMRPSSTSNTGCLYW